MKANEFITETVGKERVQTWAKMIKQNCQPYLKHKVTNYLLRGLGTEKDPFVEKTVRLSGRTPVDTTQQMHDEINDIFNQKYGAPFRDAMFCSGHDNMVKDYGKIYKIFPIGEFEFLWGGVDDLFSTWDSSGLELEDPNGVSEFIDDYIVGKYRTKQLNQAIESGREIMIRCKSYYGVHMHAMDDEFEIPMKQIMKLAGKL